MRSSGKFSSASSKRGTAANGEGPQLDAIVEQPKWFEHSVFVDVVAPPVVSQDALKKSQYRTSSTPASNAVSIDSLKADAQRALEHLAAEASKSVFNRADHKWVEDMLNTGMYGLHLPQRLFTSISVPNKRFFGTS